MLDPARVFGVFGAALNPVAHGRALAVTIFFGVILTLGYVTLRLLLVHPQRS